MFNLARIKARFKAEVREAKRFFNRKEKPFEKTDEHLKLDAPKPEIVRAVHGVKIFNKQGRRKHPLHWAHFSGFSPMRRIRFARDHSLSAIVHRMRVAGKEKTRYELRHA